MKHYTLDLTNHPTSAEKALWDGLKLEAPSVLAVLDFNSQESTEAYLDGIEYNGDVWDKLLWFTCKRDQLHTIETILKNDDGVIKVLYEGREMDCVVRVNDAKMWDWCQEGLINDESCIKIIS